MSGDRSRYFDLRAADYRRRSAGGLWKNVRAAEWRALRRELALSPGKSLLDLGCGAGYYSDLARSEGASEIVGVDESAPMMEAYRSAGFDGVLSSIEAYGPRRRFDRVLLAGVLEFCADPGPILAAAARCVKETGRIACLIPARGLVGAAYRAVHVLQGCPTFIRSEEWYFALAGRCGLRASSRARASWLGSAFCLRPLTAPPEERG